MPCAHPMLDERVSVRISAAASPLMPEFRGLATIVHHIFPHDLGGLPDVRH